MDSLGIFLAGVVFWAWMFPHDLGRWIEKVKDPYRQKPIHQKKRKA